MTPGTRSNPGRVWTRWGANLVYAVLLVIMAVVPSTSDMTELSLPDWSAHALAYGIQAALLFWALIPTRTTGGALMGAFIGATAFGTLTEGLQLLQPMRTVEIKDLFANTAGASVVCSVIAGARWISARGDDE